MQRGAERDDQRDRHELHLDPCERAAGRARPRSDEEEHGTPEAHVRAPAEKRARRSNSTGGLRLLADPRERARRARPPGRRRAGTAARSRVATQSTGVTETPSSSLQLRGLALRLLEVNREIAAELRLDQVDAVRAGDEVVDVALARRTGRRGARCIAPSGVPRAPSPTAASPFRPFSPRSIRRCPTPRPSRDREQDDDRRGHREGDVEGSSEQERERADTCERDDEEQASGRC